jgi:hypothetical protein
MLNCPFGPQPELLRQLKHLHALVT